VARAAPAYETVIASAVFEIGTRRPLTDSARRRARWRV